MEASSGKRWPEQKDLACCMCASHWRCEAMATVMLPLSRGGSSAGDEKGSGNINVSTNVMCLLA
jgi:hypothetical protein